MGQDGREIAFDVMDETALEILKGELPENCRRVLAHLLNNSLCVVTLSVAVLEETSPFSKELEHLQYAIRRLQALVGRITDLKAPVAAATSLQSST